MADRFLAFVEHTISYLLRVLPEDFDCPPPRWFITLNEPNLQSFNHYLYRIFPSGNTIGLVPTVKCLANLLEAHIPGLSEDPRALRALGHQADGELQQLLQ